MYGRAHRPSNRPFSVIHCPSTVLTPPRHRPSTAPVTAVLRLHHLFDAPHDLISLVLQAVLFPLVTCILVSLGWQVQKKGEQLLPLPSFDVLPSPVHCLPPSHHLFDFALAVRPQLCLHPRFILRNQKR